MTAAPRPLFIFEASMASARSRSGSAVLIAICALAEVCVACATTGLVYFGTDPYASGTERLWTLVGSLSALVQFGATAAIAMSLFRRTTETRQRSVQISKAAAAANAALALVGVLATLAAKRQGGDFGAYAVIGNFIFLFAAPAVLAAIGLGVFAVVRRWPGESR